jgi:hypothetical protein
MTAKKYCQIFSKGVRDYVALRVDVHVLVDLMEDKTSLQKDFCVANQCLKLKNCDRYYLDELTRLASKYKDHHVHQGKLIIISALMIIC